MLSRLLAAVLRRTGMTRPRRRSTATSREERHAAARAEKITAKAERQAEKDGLQQRAVTVDQVSAQLATLAKMCRRLERRADSLEQIIVRNRRDAGHLTEFRRLVGDGSITRHVEAAIAAAPLFDDPAPMLAIEGLFPGAVYDMFLAAIPPQDAFSVKDLQRYALQFYVGPRVGALREVVRTLPEPAQRPWAELLTAKS